MEGLGLLPASVRFGPGKVLDRPVGLAFGERVEGYELHHGVVTVDGGEPFLDGCAVGAVRGTSWHGIFENDRFRRQFLGRVAAEAGRAWRPSPDAVSFAGVREARLDVLGDLVADHLDTSALLRLIDSGPPARPAVRAARRAVGALPRLHARSGRFSTPNCSQKRPERE